MGKKPSFRIPLNRQKGKWFETLQQSESQDLTILIIHCIIHKHYLLKGDNLTQPIQMQLYKKQKRFSQIFFAFLKYILNFKHLVTKMTLIAYVFPEIRFRKTCLDKCLKSRVSEDPQTENTADVSKHCCNLNDSTFTIFINHWEGSCIGKSLFQGYTKC